MSATDSAVYYDPYDYEIDANPYPVWKRLRDEAPLYHNEEHGFYALSRYDDVLAGLLDNETFRSSHGITLEMIGDEPLGYPSIIMMDPPEHTRMRSLVSRAFTPRRIQALERRISELCDELLDDLAGIDSFDFIDSYAGIIPPTVILALAGFPPVMRTNSARRSTSPCTTKPEPIPPKAVPIAWPVAGRLVTSRACTRCSPSSSKSGAGSRRKTCCRRFSTPPWRSPTARRGT